MPEPERKTDYGRLVDKWLPTLKKGVKYAARPTTSENIRNWGRTIETNGDKPYYQKGFNALRGAVEGYKAARNKKSYLTNALRNAPDRTKQAILGTGLRMTGKLSGNPWNVADELFTIAKDPSKFNSASDVAKAILMNTPGVMFERGLPRYNPRDVVKKMVDIGPPSWRRSVNEHGRELGNVGIVDAASTTAGKLAGLGGRLVWPGYVAYKGLKSLYNDYHMDPVRLLRRYQSKLKATPTKDLGLKSNALNLARYGSALYGDTISDIPLNALALAVGTWRNGGAGWKKLGRDLGNTARYAGMTMADEVKAFPEKLGPSLKRSFMNDFNDFAAKYPRLARKRDPRAFKAYLRLLADNRRLNPRTPTVAEASAQAPRRGWNTGVVTDRYDGFKKPSKLAVATDRRERWRKIYERAGGSGYPSLTWMNDYIRKDKRDRRIVDK